MGGMVVHVDDAARALGVWVAMLGAVVVIVDDMMMTVAVAASGA
jgi:TRAP-type C4-dicarboxylate transport system permease small subunit